MEGSNRWETNGLVFFLNFQRSRIIVQKLHNSMYLAKIAQMGSLLSTIAVYRSFRPSPSFSLPCLKSCPPLPDTTCRTVRFSDQYFHIVGGEYGTRFALIK